MFTITIHYAAMPGDHQVELVQMRVGGDEVLEASGKALRYAQTITTIRIVRIVVDWRERAMRISTSANDRREFCSRHAPGPTLAAKRDDSGQPDGPDDRGNCDEYDIEHPDYDGDYRCRTCGCVLAKTD